MMKNLILLISLAIFSISLFAQEEETLKGQKGDWGLSINISGIINDIRLENDKDANGNYMVFGRKYLKDDAALRFGINVTSDRNKWTNEDSLTLGSGNRALQTVDSSRSRFDFSVLVG